MKYLADLSAVGFQASFETTCYLLALKEAAQQDAATGSARLLGHAYVRYVGGVFGEAALSKPYRTDGAGAERGLPETPQLRPQAFVAPPA